MKKVNRRQFLARTGGTLTFVAGGLQLSCSPEEAQKIDQAGLSDQQVLMLVRMFQLMLPHKDLDSQVYIDAVTGVAEQATKDTAFKQILVNGLESLGSEWLEAADEAQIASMTKLAKSGFFKTLKVRCLEGIYRDERTWKILGYEGEAMKFGGYINRGFNDIDWLPEETEVVVEGGASS